MEQLSKGKEAGEEDGGIMTDENHVRMQTSGRNFTSIIDRLKTAIRGEDK